MSYMNTFYSKIQYDELDITPVP